MPFERDADTDLVRINRVPRKLQPLEQTYKMEARWAQALESTLVVTRHYDPRNQSYFLIVYCPNKRNLLLRVLLSESAYDLHGYSLQSQNN